MSRLDQLSARAPPENPTTAVLRHAQKHKASRAPMVNPYDKFTQPEFDAWIGDMTTSIRRALGFEQEEPRLFGNIHVNGTTNSAIPEYPQLDLSDQDDIPDDSFAQIKIRRDKGKARDPREGPGLGRDRAQPIEVVSSDEEEEDEVKVLALSLRVHDPDVYDQDEDAESDYFSETPNQNVSSPPRIGPPLRSRRKVEVEESNSGSDDDDNDKYEDDDEDFVNRTNYSPEVITITSDEESVDDEDDYRPGPSCSRYPRDESGEEDADEELGAGGEVDEIQPLEDDTSFSSHHISPPRNLELNDPWEAPRKYAEDFYAGGELRLPAGARVHHLGPLDDGIEAIGEGEELLRPNEVDHSNETLSNLHSTSEFYQVYYPEGNVVTPWDQQLDPRLFAEDVDNVVDSFLTPGVLTPNRSELRTHLDETDDAVESGFMNERAQSLPLPILLSKRNEPIPQDAEIIAIDDSDDDEDSLVVVPPLDAVLEMATKPATGHLEVSEESQMNSSTPFVAVVENFDIVEEDEVLSVHTVHTEDIDHESRLQPLEIVEPKAADLQVAQENLATTFDLKPVSLEVNDLEQDSPEISEPQVILLNAVDTSTLDAGPKSMIVEVEQAPNYYEDFDDIYETPAPETLPPTEGGHFQPAGLVALDGSQTQAHEDSIDNIASQNIEVEGSQDRGLTSCPAGHAGIEANDSADVSSMGGQPPWIEDNGVVSNNIVLESAMEESVDVQTSATPNGLRKAVSTLGFPLPEDSLPKTPEFMTKILPLLLSPSRTSVPGQPQIPMPVMADANVPDPTESPTRLQEHAILSIPGTPDIAVTSLQTPQIAEGPAYTTFPLGPLLHPLNSNADGLFTPADFSIPTTPAEESNTAMLSSEWHEMDVTSSRTVAPVDLQVQAELTGKPTAPSPKLGVDIPDNISSARRSVLMADPYPYCLSAPVAEVSNDDGSSEENDDNSICSHSTAEKMAEIQFTFPLAADIEPHINSQSATTEHEDTSALLTEFDLQAMTNAHNLVEDTTVEEFGILPTPDEKDTFVAMELPDYFQPTAGPEDSPTILADESVEGSQDQATTTALQPLEAGVDADRQALVEENLEANPATPLEERKETDSIIPEDSYLQTYLEVEKGAIHQTPEVVSRPSKRKRAASPDPDRSDGFSAKSRGTPRTRSKVKQRGKEAETDVVRQPLEHDTIYVRSRPSPKRHAGDSATSELSESSNQGNVEVDVRDLIDKTPESSKAEASRLPHTHFHAPSLFHAHGRAKRQKAHGQPIASVKQTRNHEGRPAAQSTTQRTSAAELPPLQLVPSRHPSQHSEPVLPTTAGAIATEVRQGSQNPALPTAEPFPPSSTTPVPGVESPTQDDMTPFPQPSSLATADETSQPTHSTPTTLLPASSLQSSPARFLQASNSLSSIKSTRSQCKYHKIALPIGENGPRVCFLVPGCSLANQELIKEEDIEDQGEATYEDSLRMIQNIDHLDFDAYLIGTLRQLVGPDILREGEVFYLPQPGDDVPRKHWPRKPVSERTPTAKGSDYTSLAGSPGYSYSGSPSTRPPVSNADSVFTSLSGIGPTDDGSDMGNDQSPSKGKRKINTTLNGKTKDITSQPNEHGEESPDGESTQKTRRKSTKRGVKRTWTLDDATRNDGTRRSKRLRLHLTDSSLHQTHD